MNKIKYNEEILKEICNERNLEHNSHKPTVFNLPAIRPTSGQKIGPVFLAMKDIDVLPQI